MSRKYEICWHHHSDQEITMKRLIIHPRDHTTDFLTALYEGWSDSMVYNDKLTSKDVNRLFHHCSPNTQIMLLGHGSDKGLYYREDSHKEFFDNVIVGHPHRHWLQNRHNIVGIFCHADLFAKTEDLHGLYTGMIITELYESEQYGINTTEAELSLENVKFVSRLRQLLDEGCLLHEIPNRMLELNDTHSELTNFNYSNIFYL